MATALATSTAVTIVLLLLVILAMTGRRVGKTRATAALVGFGYGLLLLVSITGAGVDLTRAIAMVLVVVIVYPMVFFARGSADNISRTVRGIIALILAAALLSLVAHMLSLIGWVLIPAAVIALAVATGAMAVLGAETGTSRVARWGYWITLVLAWLMAVAGVVLSQGIGELPSSYLEVAELPQGTFIAMALGVLALAAVDPLLRQTVASSESGFPVGALVMGVALIAGVIFAPLLMFGGSFIVPSVPFLIAFGFMPAGAIGIALALASLAVVTLIPCYLAVAGKMLAEVVRLDGTDKEHDEATGATPGSIILAAVVAGSLAIALSAPSVLVVVASLLAAAAGGAALSGIRPGLHAVASILGAVVGAIPATFTGGTEFFAWNWATAVGLVVAAVAGAATAAVLGRAGSPKGSSEPLSEVDHPVI